MNNSSRNWVEWGNIMQHLISITGAGPGDPELISIKGYNRLKDADVVLYDALSGDEILKWTKPDTVLIYAGKLQGDGQDQKERQDYIHDKLLECAQQGLKVVRLKAGDPMVLGRGAEEIRFCKKHGLNYEVIPGITASVAASSLFEVPLTERNKSPMFLISTGHRSEKSLFDLSSVIHVLSTNSTVSLYMGLNALPGLSSDLMDKGVDPSIHVHVMSFVSQANQSIVSGELSTIAKIIEKEKPPTPAVIVLGKYAEKI